MIFEKNPSTTAVSMPKSFHLTPMSPTFKIHQPTLVAHGYHFDNGELLIFYVVIVRVRIKNINQPSIIVQVQLNGETYHVFHVSFIH